MSRVISDLRGTSPAKGREPRISYPYTLPTATGVRWEVGNINHDPIVYIIKAENGLYKIGYTKSIIHRFSEFENVSPIPVELLHLITTNNAMELEKQIHERLFPFWHHGEWFALPEETVNWLLSIEDMQYEQSRVPYIDEFRVRWHGVIRRVGQVGA